MCMACCLWLNRCLGAAVLFSKILASRSWVYADIVLPASWLVSWMLRRVSWACWTMDKTAANAQQRAHFC